MDLFESFFYSRRAVAVGVADDNLPLLPAFASFPEGNTIFEPPVCWRWRTIDVAKVNDRRMKMPCKIGPVFGDLDEA